MDRYLLVIAPYLSSQSGVKRIRTDGVKTVCWAEHSPLCSCSGEPRLGWGVAKAVGFQRTRLGLGVAKAVGFRRTRLGPGVAKAVGLQQWT